LAQREGSKRCGKLLAEKNGRIVSMAVKLAYERDMMICDLGGLNVVYYKKRKYKI